MIAVPRLEGRDQMAATRMLEAVGLHMGEVGRQPSDGPRDTVVEQSPVAGTPVQPGAPVQIWLAVPRPATVPELRGRDRAGAAEALTSARLVLGEIGERPSADPSGTVVGQSPSAGTVVRPGLPVQVWFAVPIPIEVPALVGRREADAAAILRESDFVPARYGSANHRAARRRSRSGAAGGTASERRHDGRSVARHAGRSWFRMFGGATNEPLGTHCDKRALSWGTFASERASRRAAR